MYGQNGIELIPITEEEWRNSNGYYTPETFLIYGYIMDKTKTNKKNYKYILTQR